jgi:hypothetical protein
VRPRWKGEQEKEEAWNMTRWMENAAAPHHEREKMSRVLPTDMDVGGSSLEGKGD